MVNLSLLNHIKHYPAVTFIPDIRSIKVKSGNSLVDYLQTQLWCEHNVQTKIIPHPQESKKVLNLQFVDYISNIIWKRYEDNQFTPFQRLRPYLDNRCLYF